MWTKLRATLILASALLWVGANAGAVVLCQKKSGAAFVRPDTCKKKETQVDVATLLGDLPTRLGTVEGTAGSLQSTVSGLQSSINSLQSSVSDLQSAPIAVPADQRFALEWETGAGQRHAAIRGDASIRDSDEAGLVVTKVGMGQYCIEAPGASEGAVGVLQNQGSSNGTILVSMGIGSFCNSVSGANITVETFSF
ncbi:MAG: hypothetical protein ACREQL_10955 [Candidatus Binatia bacterium]